ncbi:MAG: preprotein translocase subunit SecG [Planctomycetota bacterium]|nr:MAG: preprotein translocase subunit SecG [Planctomycetota bacterium]
MITLVRFFLGLMLVLSALFLILLVLIQRGRGGGLAGAFGGAGGQSAFGTKAGDVFTKITIGVAAFWILLCVLAVNILGRQQSLISDSLGGSAPVSTGNTPLGGGTEPADALAPSTTPPAGESASAPGEAGAAAETPPATATEPASPEAK